MTRVNKSGRARPLPCSSASSHTVIKEVRPKKLYEAAPMWCSTPDVPLRALTNNARASAKTVPSGPSHTSALSQIWSSTCGRRSWGHTRTLRRSTCSSQQRHSTCTPAVIGCGGGDENQHRQAHTLPHRSKVDRQMCGECGPWVDGAVCLQDVHQDAKRVVDDAASEAAVDDACGSGCALAPKTTCPSHLGARRCRCPGGTR